MSIITRALIRKLPVMLLGSFKPHKIILFGSYAYGKPTEDSDVDILVVSRLVGAIPKKQPKSGWLLGRNSRLILWFASLLNLKNGWQWVISFCAKSPKR